MTSQQILMDIALLMTFTCIALLAVIALAIFIHYKIIAESKWKQQKDN
jgi:predicted membrane protein